MIGADKAALIKEVGQVLRREPRNLYQTRALRRVPGSLYETRTRTQREPIARRYSYLRPTVAQVQRAKRFGRTQLGSPGIEEKFTEIWNWAKKHWPYITAGGVLYAILLIACSRRPK